MPFQLRDLLRALLLSSSEPLTIRAVQDLIARFHEQREESSTPDEALTPALAGAETVPSLITAAEIRETLETMARELEMQNDAWRLTCGPEGWKMMVAPGWTGWIRLFRQEPTPARLSRAALETLAIVAYRQPATRAEIEAIRGVASDGPLNRLQELGMIERAGRADAPGKPSQFRTTLRFLEFCGLRSLEELPASDVLSPEQLTAWVRTALEPRQALSEAAMGLPGDAGAVVEAAAPGIQTVGEN